jgi:two-component system response regulator
MTDRLLLLVEDNRDDEALVLRALRKGELSPRVVVAHDGVEALKYLLPSSAAEERIAPLPHLVLLDMNLPRMSGLEVLRRLRADERTRRLPVVMLTSSREERDVAQSYDLGATSYVRKPIGSEEFAEVIRQVALYWLSLNEVQPRTLQAS